MYGAPGKDTWEGGAFVNENLDDTGLPKVHHHHFQYVVTTPVNISNWIV